MLARLQMFWVRWGLTRAIRRKGWTGIYVFDDDGAGFAYSIGFPEAFGSPEVVLFNQPGYLADGLIGEAARQIGTGELVLADNLAWNLEWEGGPAMVWRQVHRSRISSGYLTMADWWGWKVGREVGLEAFQLVFSDPNGRLPWDDGYDLAFGRHQRELWRI